VTLGAMYDSIFATTNANCPVQGRGEGGLAGEQRIGEGEDQEAADRQREAQQSDYDFM
jgi:hypothetical protein